MRLGWAGVNGEEKGVYYPVDKAADWPLQFRYDLGVRHSSLFSVPPLWQTCHLRIASQVLARLVTRETPSAQREGAERRQPGLSLQ